MGNITNAIGQNASNNHSDSDSQSMEYSVSKSIDDGSDSFDQEAYEEYIKKHNKPKKKKKKKKGKKLKKTSSKKNVHSPLIMAESESVDLWDAFEAEAKNKQCDEEKKKKKIAEKYLYKNKTQENELSDSVSSVSSENDGISQAKKKKITIKQSEIDKKLDPKYRKKEREKKAAKNLSRTGFKVKVNRRYRIDDGRIGICRYRGRTAFGKDGEDWIGMMVEYGDGIHNGTVKGKKYFICAAGKGIMVRPQRIVQDLGLPNGQTLDKKMIKGSKSIRKLLQDIAFEKEEEYQKKLRMKKKKKRGKQRRRRCMRKIGNRQSLMVWKKIMVMRLLRNCCIKHINLKMMLSRGVN